MLRSILQVWMLCWRPVWILEKSLCTNWHSAIPLHNFLQNDSNWVHKTNLLCVIITIQHRAEAEKQLTSYDNSKAYSPNIKYQEYSELEDEEDPELISPPTSTYLNTCTLHSMTRTRSRKFPSPQETLRTSRKLRSIPEPSKDNRKIENFQNL